MVEYGVMENVLAVNKRAYFDYEVLDTLHTGVSLLGWEVKSLKQKNVSLKEGFVRARNGEVFLLNVYVAPYQHAELKEDLTKRNRKLLLNKREIRLLDAKQQLGLTIVPLKFFVRKGLIKLEIGIARGKKKYDKREILRKKAIQRDVEIALRDKSN